MALLNYRLRVAGLQLPHGIILKKTGWASKAAHDAFFVSLHRTRQEDDAPAPGGLLPSGGGFGTKHVLGSS